jgi:uncharacterized membrane protein YeaQ/YmgE (transglycosylase-associated protein family)
MNLHWTGSVRACAARQRSRRPTADQVLVRCELNFRAQMMISVPREFHRREQTQPYRSNFTSTENDMNVIIWLAVGGVLGWLASLAMNTDGQQGIFLNVVVGIIGALIAGFVVAPLLGTGTINTSDFSLSGLLVSFIGAVILLAIVNMYRRGRVR